MHCVDVAVGIDSPVPQKGSVNHYGSCVALVLLLEPLALWVFPFLCLHLKIVSAEAVRIAVQSAGGLIHYPRTHCAIIEICQCGESNYPITLNSIRASLGTLRSTP
jgi:hypothetical protein